MSKRKVGTARRWFFRRSTQSAGTALSIARGALSADGSSAFTRLAAWVTLAAAVGALVVGRDAMQARAAGARSAPAVSQDAWPALAPGGGENDATTWLPESVQRTLVAIVEGAISPDPFDVNSLETAHKALSATGWFREGPFLRRGPGGVVRVEGEWRIPAAVVRTAARDARVASGGELLPVQYPSGGAWPLRVVRGAWASAPADEFGAPRYGAPWVGGDVQGALALLGALRGTQAWKHVAAIDVSGFVQGRPLTILTTEGASVVWGSAPGAGAPGEQPDAEKLRRFVLLVKNPAWIAASRPRVELFTPYVYLDDTAARR